MAQPKKKTTKKTSQTKKTAKGRTTSKSQNKFTVTVDSYGVIKSIKPM